MWKGEPVEQIDSQIKLFLSDESPNEKLNPNNWTAEWEGFLRVPITAEYLFTCEGDDGCIVYLNQTIIIQDNLSEEPQTDLLKP
mmetsp:Transcript_54774/g.46121  ORF Transcript_54774/g.46121 Transcript_54774/m.46121 type:complete len:84 (+) Transcript_54774:682-933(+)